MREETRCGGKASPPEKMIALSRRHALLLSSACSRGRTLAIRLLLFAPATALPLERFEVLTVNGELMISRTAATCSSLRPSLRPISSAEGTRFLMTYAAMEKLLADLNFDFADDFPSMVHNRSVRCARRQASDRFIPSCPTPPVPPPPPMGVTHLGT